MVPGLQAAGNSSRELKAKVPGRWRDRGLQIEGPSYCLVTL